MSVPLFICNYPPLNCPLWVRIRLNFLKPCGSFESCGSFSCGSLDNCDLKWGSLAKLKTPSIKTGFSLFKRGRGGRIRTCDPLLPKHGYFSLFLVYYSLIVIGSLPKNPLPKCHLLAYFHLILSFQQDLENPQLFVFYLILYISQ